MIAAFHPQHRRSQLTQAEDGSVRGNSHPLMVDANSDEVAGLVQAWIAAKGMMR